MSSIVLQLSSVDSDPRGIQQALSALSQQLAAASDLKVQPPPLGSPLGLGATLTVSLVSGDSPRTLASVLSDWSVRYSTWRLTVKSGASQIEISGAQTRDAVLQQILAVAPVAPVAPVPAASGPLAAPSAPASRPLFSLTRLSDGQETAIDGVVLAGRHPECGLRLPSATKQGGPSRRHARLSIGEGAMWVEDLGSTNGTFVNGTRITTRTRLRPADRLRFDRVEFEVHAPVAEQDEKTLMRPPQPQAALVTERIVPPQGLENPPSVELDPGTPAPGEGRRPEVRGEGRTVFIPPELVNEMTAFVVEGAGAKPRNRPPPLPPRRTEIRILDEDQVPIDPVQSLQAHQRYTLEVSIQVQREMGRLAGPMTIEEPQGEPVWVFVVLTDETGGPRVEGQLFELDHRYAALRLPLVGNSEGAVSFRFAARPPQDLALTREIRPRIGVRIYHKLNLIDHTQVDLRFVEKGSAPEAPPPAIPDAEGLGLAIEPAVYIRSMQVEGRPIEQPEADSASRALTISISKPDPLGTDYRFALVAANRVHPGQPGLFASRKLSQEELDGYSADFRDIVLKSVLGRSLTDANMSPADQESLLSRLAALGDRIVARLFSPSAQDDIFELGDLLPELSIIQICLGEGAQDVALPWQILTIRPATNRGSPGDPRNLWGYRFVIEIKRAGDGVDTRPPSARQVPAARVTYARGVENDAAHQARLTQIVTGARFPAALVDPVVESRTAFMGALQAGGSELLYVYAHGHSAPPSTPDGSRVRAAVQSRVGELGTPLEGTVAFARNDLENLRRVQIELLKAMKADGSSALSLKRSVLELTDLGSRIERKASSLSDAPIVFLNACESAQIWTALTGSFTAFFLDRGARAVLGTESTVPMVVADLFGLAVLESLLQGDTLGKAVHSARWKLLQERKNPLGLCYVIHGAADSRLRSGRAHPGPEEVPTAALTFTSGPRMGERVILRPSGQPGQSSEWTLGSDPGQDIPLAADGVSRQHATLIHEEGRRWRIVDRNSRNGTFVGNRRTDNRPLTPGTEIRLGTVGFVFELFDRTGRKWGTTVSTVNQPKPRPPIDMVLLLVASLVVGAVVFFVISFVPWH